MFFMVGGKVERIIDGIKIETFKVLEVVTRSFIAGRNESIR